MFFYSILVYGTRTTFQNISPEKNDNFSFTFQNNNTEKKKLSEFWALELRNDICNAPINQHKFLNRFIFVASTKARLFVFPFVSDVIYTWNLKIFFYFNFCCYLTSLSTDVWIWKKTIACSLCSTLLRLVFIFFSRVFTFLW